MADNREKYQLGTVNLADVRNRNELRVIKALKELQEEGCISTLEQKLLQDLYALTLNLLPARYAQKGTIVVHEPVRMEDIKKTLRMAYENIVNNPKN